jgi:acyl dehydratase
MKITATENLLYFEDLEIGQRYLSSSQTLAEADMIDFANRFDPQPFHTDPIAAEDSFFGRLCASGWHTASVTMRLFVTGDLRIAGGLIGAGVNEMRWPVPTYPGDTLTVTATILDKRLSRSKPQWGLVKVQVTATNQRDQTAQEMIANLVVPLRPGGSADA